MMERTRPVEFYARDGETKVFRSIRDASLKLHMSKTTISRRIVDGHCFVLDGKAWRVREAWEE